MKTHKIVFKHLGENATTTRCPHEPLDTFTGDLTKKVGRCMAFDNDMPVSIDLYSVEEITLPEWLPPAEWISRSIDWGYAWARGMDPTWSESWQRKLLLLPHAKQFAAIKLLKVKNFRSEFRAKMRVQLEAWLNGGSEYASPFSPRQWDCVLDRRDYVECNRIDDTSYWGGASKRGVVMVEVGAKA